MKKKIGFRPLSLLNVAVAAGVASAALFGINPISEAQAQIPQTIVSLPDFSKLVEDNGKAVVSIETLKRAKRIRGSHPAIPPEQLEMLKRFGFPFPFGDFGNFGGTTPERRGQGSGFIISPDGYILTNHHVVDGADEVTVHLTDKRDFKAKVVGSDAKTDIAVIKVNAKDLPIVKLGNSDNVKVGEWVAAIGAPFGLDNTVTAGIVSAKSRNLPDDQFVPFIQTDVAVNPGNSGGPLFNMNGEVIGINSQIFSTSGGFMGLSFAIPIDLAVQIKDQLIKDGKVSRGRIGIVMQPMSEELAKSFNVPNKSGALVAQLEKDGPADKAGIKEGDIIIEFDGKPIDEIRKLSQLVATTKPGTKVNLKVIRQGKPQNIVITVEEMPFDGIKNFKNAKVEDRLGVTVRPLNQEEKKRFTAGIVVESVSGPAQEAGIQAGDVILNAGGKTIKAEEDLNKAVKNSKSSIALLIDRQGTRIFYPIKLSQNGKENSKK